VYACDPGQAQRAIWRHLVSMDDWDVLRLMQVPEGSPTPDGIGSLARRDRCLTGSWESCLSPYVATVGSWPDYERSWKSKHRSILKNRLARLESLGPVRFETITSGGDELRRALAEGLRIEALAWKAESGTAILSDRQAIRFYEKLAEVGAERGWLRLIFLTVGGRRIAFSYALEYDRRLYGLKTGYDPDFARCSPGSLLFHHILRTAFEGDVVEYDFLGDEARWKRDWCPRLRSHTWSYVFRPGLAPRLVHAVKFRALPRLRRYGPFLRLREAVLRRVERGAQP
jgi:CelD/BcsL family acetyltransferase involved in cellulose biosynthesis